MAKAKLTPLAKILIAISIIGLASAAVWHLGLKDMGGDSAAPTASGSAATSGSPAVADGALGSTSNPLKVSIVSFHGYAPALLANGKSLKTQPGSAFAKQGVNIEFVIQDNIPTLTEIFEAKTAHCAWRTSDFWAQGQPNLRNNKLDARAVVVVDNTQGADAIIARDSSIQRVEDLVGKKVALLQFTPSHGMIIDAVENSSLTARQKTKVEYIYINVDEGTAGVRAAFESGHVDAAVLWDPDLALAVKAVKGAHVIYSTKIATNLIYDVIVCNKAVLDKAENQAAIQGFVKGWMDGVPLARADPDGAVDALVKTEEFFALLVQKEGSSFVKELFDNLVWTGIEDNARILGLAGGTNHYERVYKRFDGIYRGIGALSNPKSPVINPSDSFDYRYIKALIKAKPAVVEVAKKPQFTFTEKERDDVTSTKAPVVTRPVIVNFQTGSAQLTKRAQRIIDQEMVPLVESHGSAYFEVSGNTDSTGAAAVNMRLSRQRAEAVVKYLVQQWEFPAERFKVVGNGPNKPLCNENKPDEGLDLPQCRARNRATRLAIVAR